MFTFSLVTEAYLPPPPLQSEKFPLTQLPMPPISLQCLWAMYLTPTHTPSSPVTVFPFQFKLPSFPSFHLCPTHLNPLEEREQYAPSELVPTLAAPKDLQYSKLPVPASFILWICALCCSPDAHHQIKSYQEANFNTRNKIPDPQPRQSSPQLRTRHGKSESGKGQLQK